MKEKKSQYSGGQVYGQAYYENYLMGDGTHDYADRDFWVPIFQHVAKRLIELYQPNTFLDVGCAYGYLVEALRDLGVEAYGVDISAWAVSQAREDIRPYCFACNVAEGLPEQLPEQFDCISAIEVAEHLYEEDIQAFLHTICTHTQQVVFSSTPDAFSDPSHFNVQQQEYWAKRFAREGFLHELNMDLGFLSPQALAFKKEEKAQVRLIEDYERAARLQKMRAAKELATMRNAYQADVIRLEQQADALRNNTHEVHELLRQKDIKIEQAKQNAAAWQRECGALQHTLAAAREHEQQLQTVHDQIVNSTFWRMTWPGRRVISACRKRMGKGQPTVQQSMGQQGLAAAQIATDCFAPALKEGGLSVREYLRMEISEIRQIETIASDDSVQRLNVVTDSIAPSSLLGGVATALILATQFANKKNLPLRIITLVDEIDPLNFKNILDLNEIAYPQQVEFYCANTAKKDGAPLCRLPVGEKDVFFATSWWSAKAIQGATVRKDFYYILQEVETFFYPHGDRHLLCSQIMEDPNIHFIVNSKFLWDYFQKNNPNIVQNGVYFDPAFSKKMYREPAFAVKKKHRLFFYARPNNPRNLFGYGLMLLDTAIQRGILDTSEWELCFAGQQFPDLVFCDGSRPVHCGQMSWQEYGAFVAQTDLALSLMYTPHPSYPPYDVAVSGGVVITNACLNKTDFVDCANIIVSPLEVDEFMVNLQKSMALAKDVKTRKQNYEQMTIARDWEETLKETIRQMEEWL